MQTISLNGTWALRGSRQDWLPPEEVTLNATVPGCVQLDLSRQGFLPEDLFLGENTRAAEKYEDWQWWYTRKFEAPPTKENVYLVFEGVDCIADYYLNDVQFGSSENAFIAHEFRVDPYLKDGENTLTVHIKSPILEAQDKEYYLKLLHSDKHLEARYLRKPHHSYGWDIMPRMVTSGLWREVRLEVRDAIYFTQAIIQTYREPYRFLYTLDCDWRNMENVFIQLEASCGSDSKIFARHRASKKFGSFAFDIPNPKKWFPYGYGKANVYDGTVKIFQEDKLIHEQPISFGIRKVTLDRHQPTDGSKGQFRILINDVEIMCKGSNWVPLDAFHCRDAERYDRALALVKDIGCNILRCWGGNVYEDHKFFDFCDRNGIMVWQDFAMACVFNPETPEFQKSLEAEATAVIRKLRNHPSLILWAGDNEVDSASDGHDPATNTNNRQILPKCVDLNDAGRPYLPSSPYIPKEAFNAGIASQVPGSRLVEDHLWGPRDYYKGNFYKYNAAHFVSETGYHGCPSLESIRKFITPDRVWPYHDNPEWILHSSDQNGNPDRVMLMEKHVRQLFGEVPADPETYILASQISQAEAKKYFIERMRVNRPEKTGIIWWNLLDGWPQMSDAVVDYYFTKKLAYSYIKRSQAPFVIAADEISDWELTLFACNDTLEQKQGHLTVQDALTEKILWDGDFSAKENTSTPIAQIPTYYSEQKILIFSWEANGESGFNHYLCGYPPISLAMYKEVLNKYNL